MWDGMSLIGRVTGHPNPQVGVLPQTLTSAVVGKKANQIIVTRTGTEYHVTSEDIQNNQEFFDGLRWVN